ncbi:MAG: RNA pseudouridine synthase [Spirochaetaceae bacterium]|jgi:23S rRNA pseudouridine1911/1915/1917 synthase|nr:RNA pseudouridine synthase [Spirochaetaceae bacterium]
MDNDIGTSAIIYASDQCVVVNKRCGEAVEGAGKGMIDLPSLLQKQFGAAAGSEKNSFTAVNRLDVPVSGCAIFARGSAALAFLNAAFADRIVQKHYWAIVEQPNADLKEEGELIHWLATDRRSNKSAAFAEAAPGRKKAVLRYKIAGAGTHYLFLEIELITGRRHQIRAQLAALGLHIKGDLKYGAKRSEKTGGIRLHAYSLRFPAPPGSPESGASILAQAPPPLRDRLWEDFERCVVPLGA